MDRSLADIVNNRKKKRKNTRLGSDDNDMPPPAKAHRPNLSLGPMLYPTRIPEHKYDAIQKVIWDQDKTIVERGKVISHREKLIHELKEQLAVAVENNEHYRERLVQRRGHIDDRKERLQMAKSMHDPQAAARELRERKQYYEEYIEDQSQFMGLGRKVLAEKTEQATRLTAEVHQLQTLIGARDAAISALHDKIQCLAMASADELAAIAIESQAERTLGMVDGLQEEIAQRDMAIENYKAKNTALVAANESYSIKNQDLNRAVAAHKKGVDGAGKQAADAKGIIDDQGALIETLMEENARLVANQMAQ